MINNESNFKMNDLFIKTEYEKPTSNTDNILSLINIEKPTIMNSCFSYYCVPNVISNTLCDFIINESEKYADMNSGWQTKRHRNYPTTDIPIKEIPNLNTLVLNLIRYEVFPLISYKYNVSKYFLDCNDIFIVKYDANFQNKLDRHKDGSVFSFNILLNDLSNFEGGGTIIDENGVDVLVSNTKGGVLLHSGRCFHSGNQITKGVRYILVGFVSYMKEYSINDEIPQKISCKKNINSWHITSQYLKQICDSINTISDSYILNTDKNDFNIIEKFIYELSMFHIKRLDKEWNNKKYFIEFWWKNDIVTNNLFIHRFHIDKDEFVFKKNNQMICPILSTVTYLNNSNCPTVIYNGKIRNIDNTKVEDLILSFPMEFKHICFDGSMPHGAIQLFNQELNSENNTRKTLMFNIWEDHRPMNVEFAELKDFSQDINNTFYNKDDELFTLNDFDENNYIKNIVIQPNVLRNFVKNCAYNKLDLNNISEFQNSINLDDINQYNILKITV
jgi:hypothetical protein